MAHSYLEFRNRSLLLKDLDILGIAHCALEEGGLMRAGDTLPSAIEKMLQVWPYHLETAGVGCLDLQLDNILSTQDDVRTFLALLERIEQRFKNFGSVVPGSYLNGLLKSKVIFYGDRPTEDWVTVIDRIRDLLTGRIWTDR